MGLVRWEERTWDPFRELEEMSTRLNRFFGRALLPMDGDVTPGASEWSPSVNIAETEKAYMVTAEIPQVKREDVHVTLEGQTLTIEGNRKHEREEKGLKYHRVESYYGHFLRRFTLPDDIEAAKLEATYKDGMLHIAIPKVPIKRTPALEVKIH
jgi:HSP20 family protein